MLGIEPTEAGSRSRYAIHCAMLPLPSLAYWINYKKMTHKSEETNISCRQTVVVLRSRF